MDASKIRQFVNSPAYPVVAAAASIGVGIGVGILADRIFCGKAEAEGELEDGWWEDSFGSDDDPVEYPEPVADFPPIPEGVNEVGDIADKVVNDELFKKPDISRMVDYTKYSDPGKNLNDVKIEKDRVVVPDDTDSPEDLDDDRFEIIDEKEFVKAVGNGDGWAEATGTYFTQDRILAGWNDDLEEKDVSNTVGWRAIHMFDDQDVKAVYVRNVQLKVLYEIVRSDNPMEQAIQDAIADHISEVQE